jgi:hypothetical protein
MDTNAEEKNVVRSDPFISKWWNKPEKRREKVLKCMAYDIRHMDGQIITKNSKTYS